MSNEVPGGRGRPRPRLRTAQILAWAEDHRARTGAWPSALSGPVGGAPGETWAALNVALRYGFRGLPGGDTLARLLCRERGADTRPGRPPDASRRQQASRLRAAGLTLAEVGRRLGVSRQAAFEMLKAASGELGPGAEVGRWAGPAVPC